jgi:molybdate transport system substrate-binding protein
VSRVAVLLLLALGAFAAGAQPVTIAAAAHLQHALPEIERARPAGGGDETRIVYGSSGLLYRQIVQGAPFEIFFSADEILAQRLIEDGRAEAPGAVYGVGRLALMLPRASATDLGDPRAALVGGNFRRLAIANPDHAPYGRAALEALERLGLSERYRGRSLLLGENVEQAARFVLDGGAEAGLVALAVALGAGDKARHAVLPAELHAPIRQRVVLIGRPRPEARAVFARLISPEARRVLLRHGIEAPE